MVHGLRNTDTDLRIPRFATSYGQRSFSYRGVKVWNKLSTEIKNASSLATFQNLLKQSLKIKGRESSCTSSNFSFYFIIRTYCMLIFVYLGIELYVD